MKKRYSSQVYKLVGVRMEGHFIIPLLTFLTYFTRMFHFFIPWQCLTTSGHEILGEEWDTLNNGME